MTADDDDCADSDGSLDITIWLDLFSKQETAMQRHARRDHGAEAVRDAAGDCEIGRASEESSPPRPLSDPVAVRQSHPF